MLTKTHSQTIRPKDKYSARISRHYPVDKSLYNERTFYIDFTKDVMRAKREVVIYSPFVSTYRSARFKRTLTLLKERNIDLFIFTRRIEDYDPSQQKQAEEAINQYKAMGAHVSCLYGSIHEKVAIIDREVLWEGSLNILSQRTSREIMRRTVSETSATQVMVYLGLDILLVDVYRIKYQLPRNMALNSRWRMPRFSVRISLVTIAVVWWLFSILSAMIPLKVVTVLLSVLMILSHR